MPEARYALMSQEVLAPAAGARQSNLAGRDWRPATFQFADLEDRLLRSTGVFRMARGSRCSPLPTFAKPGSRVLRGGAPAEARRAPAVPTTRGPQLVASVAPCGVMRELTRPSGVDEGQRRFEEARRTSATPVPPAWAARQCRTGLGVAQPLDVCLPGGRSAEPVWRTARLAEAETCPVLPSVSPSVGRSLTPLPGVDARPLTLEPSKVSSTPRVSGAPFAPQDLLLTRDEFPIQGKFAEALETETRIDEHFSSGLGRWTGGSEKWRMDVAGVRVGPLALFTPSMGFRDYDLEFLARIESGGLSWVFRAADLDNYHLVKIVAAEGREGAFELRRCTVTAGVAEPPVSEPLAGVIRGKSTFTVQMSVCGKGFAMFVDGKEVIRWTDARLATGGIGFLAEGGDRARLYWVKLESPGRRLGSAPAV